MKVTLFPNFYESNLTKENRVKWIAKLASISYGNEDAKDPWKLVKRLYDRGHQSLFEFIRLPYLDNSKVVCGYRIDDSLRHNPYLATISDFSCPEELIDTFKRSLVLLKLEVPIFVDRQLVRHRSDSRIEMSRRYVKPNKVEFSYWFPEELPPNHIHNLAKSYKERYEKNLKLFNRAELARYDQPLNLYTTYYVLRDFRGARNFYVRRFNKHAQKETREIVTKELEVLRELQPEFEGQYVYTVDGYERIHILDLKDYAKSQGLDKVLCHYGDQHYYAVFDAESGYFVDDTPVSDTLFSIMFGNPNS
jgi:hypothetical protein